MLDGACMYACMYVCMYVWTYVLWVIITFVNLLSRKAAISGLLFAQAQSARVRPN